MRPAAIAWHRVAIEDAGVSLDQNPAWPTLAGDRLVYQRFSNEGTVSVRWGPDAAIEEVLAQVGLGSGGSTRVIEADHATVVDGAPARRVRLRVTAPAATATAMTPLPPSDPERVYVFLGFKVQGTSVFVGYRAPSSELATFAPLLEHILASVRVGKGTALVQKGPKTSPK